MKEKFKQLAAGVAVGLAITIVVLPMLRLFVETSLVAKTIVLLLLPGLAIAGALVRESANIIFYSVVGLIQVLYWHTLWSLWLQWRNRK